MLHSHQCWYHLKIKFLLGHSTNDPYFLHVEYTSIDTAKMFACILDANKDDVTACFHLAPALRVSDITVPITPTDMLSDTTLYKNALLPVALLITFCMNNIKVHHQHL